LRGKRVAVLVFNAKLLLPLGNLLVPDSGEFFGLGHIDAICPRISRLRAVARGNFILQAVIFLTHVTTRRIVRHFSRLRRETASRLDAFLCLHQTTPFTLSRADLFIKSEDSQRVLPKRFEERQRSGRTSGFVDLACFPAFQRLKHYSHIWFVEYDVDYAGDWDSFFAPRMDSGADLLATTIFPQAESKSWAHWPDFAAPPGARPLRSFIPMFRISQLLFAHYVEAVGTGHWQGHFEALLPTIADYYGLQIEDMGAYCNTPNDSRLSPGTFVWLPVQSESYFHEVPSNFSRREVLYHPVKVRLTILSHMAESLKRRLF
jgi:hypothetical protein